MTKGVFHNTSSKEVLPVPALPPSLILLAGLDWEVEALGPPAILLSASEARARPLSSLPACSKACQLAEQFIQMLQHSLLIFERSRAPRTVKCERKNNTYLMKRVCSVTVLGTFQFAAVQGTLSSTMMLKSGLIEDVTRSCQKRT